MPVYVGDAGAPARELYDVDPEQVSEWLARGAEAIANHADACMCAWCMMADLDQTIAERGQNPSRYWIDLSQRGGGYRPTPWWYTKPPRQFEMRKAEFPSLPQWDEFVPVPVSVLHVGAWARFRGVGSDGAALVVSGAVLAGPDAVRGGAAYAVLVRTYRDDQGDRLVFVPADVPAELVDDPADYEARARQAVEPVFGPPTAMLTWRRVKNPQGRVTHEWTYHESVTADQLAVWEAPGRNDTVGMLTAVWRDHAKIPEDML